LATEAEILRCHSKEMFDVVRSSATMSEEQLKKLSSRYDAVFFNQV
jgi:acetoin utilization deacetylase AcuC-like enzyme